MSKHKFEWSFMPGKTVPLIIDKFAIDKYFSNNAYFSVFLHFTFSDFGTVKTKHVPKQF